MPFPGMVLPNLTHTSITVTEVQLSPVWAWGCSEFRT